MTLITNSYCCYEHLEHCLAHCKHSISTNFDYNNNYYHLHKTKWTHTHTHTCKRETSCCFWCTYSFQWARGTCYLALILMVQHTVGTHFRHFSKCWNLALRLGPRWFRSWRGNDGNRVGKRENSSASSSVIHSNCYSITYLSQAIFSKAAKKKRKQLKIWLASQPLIFRLIKLISKRNTYLL